jgi:hypothetical protein
MVCEELKEKGELGVPVEAISMNFREFAVGVDVVG